jgi:hypothetical protein
MQFYFIFLLLPLSYGKTIYSEPFSETPTQYTNSVNGFWYFLIKMCSVIHNQGHLEIKYLCWLQFSLSVAAACQVTHYFQGEIVEAKPAY